MKDQERFEQALRSNQPTEALRAFALELAAAGRKRREIYELFLSFHTYLQNERRGQDEAVLGDVMDMITGTYAPFNLELPQ